MSKTKKDTKRTKYHLGPVIVLCSIVVFLISIVLIKIVDCLFCTSGCEMTVIEHISAGEVLSYLGGVLSAIATGVLSYLVYRKEKRSIAIEEENARPALFVTMFGGVEADVNTFSCEPKNSIISILSGEPPEFSYGIYLVENKVEDSKFLCARRYNFKFKYSGEIRCKKIRINKIEFLPSDNSEKATDYTLQDEDSIFDAFECGKEYTLILKVIGQAILGEVTGNGDLTGTMTAAIADRIKDAAVTLQIETITFVNDEVPINTTNRPITIDQ